MLPWRDEETEGQRQVLTPGGTEAGAVLDAVGRELGRHLANIL